MAFTGSIEDRLAIRELYSTYGDSSSRGDTEAWLDCWADEGVWHSHLFTRVGKAELREQWDQLWVAFEKVAFLGDLGSAEVHGEEAVTRCIAREIIRLKDGGIYKLVGRYDDLLVRRDGRWLFARRDYTPLVEEVPE